MYRNLWVIDHLIKIVFLGNNSGQSLCLTTRRVSKRKYTCEIIYSEHRWTALWNCDKAAAFMRWWVAHVRYDETCDFDPALHYYIQGTDCLFSVPDCCWCWMKWKSGVKRKAVSLRNCRKILIFCKKRKTKQKEIYQILITVHCEQFKLSSKFIRQVLSQHYIWDKCSVKTKYHLLCYFKGAVVSISHNVRVSLNRKTALHSQPNLSKDVKGHIIT